MKKAASKEKSAPAKDVEAYLASAPKEMRAILDNLRAAIKAAAPKAEELISYRIPTYNYHGPLVTEIRDLLSSKEYSSRQQKAVKVFLPNIFLSLFSYKVSNIRLPACKRAPVIWPCF